MTVPTCAFVPYMNRCDRPGQYGGYCLHHSNTHCVVCGQQATHMCGGWVGSFVCGADVCDGCDDWKAGTKHDCGARPNVSISVADYLARERAREAERETKAAEAKANPKPYVEDPRYTAEKDPQGWTLDLMSRRLVATLWGHCDPCGTSRTLPLRDLIEAGRGGQLVSSLKVQCHTCHQPGHVRVVWKRGNGQRCFHDFGTGESKGNWPRADFDGEEYRAWCAAKAGGAERVQPGAERSEAPG